VVTVVAVVFPAVMRTIRIVASFFAVRRCVRFGLVVSVTLSQPGRINIVSAASARIRRFIRIPQLF
jgi:hypothetical protein